MSIREDKKKEVEKIEEGKCQLPYFPPYSDSAESKEGEDYTYFRSSSLTWK